MVCDNKVLQNFKKVLIFQEAWGRGGIESYVMSMLRNAESGKYKVEVFSAYDWYNGYDTELKKLDVKRTVISKNIKPSYLYRLITTITAWNKRLSNEDIDVVHVNAMNGLTLLYLAVAKKHGVPVRIAHSHNTNFSGGARALKLMVHRLACRVWGKSATHRLSCSDAAAKYLFGNQHYTLVRNGVDANRFSFNQVNRNIIRESLEVPNDVFLFGSIGRLSYQKNPLFTLEILSELLSMDIDCRLILIGDGELEEEMGSKVEKQGLNRYYIHLPSVDNPESYYSALDAFVLPSLFEGVPYSVIEAQCSGLPVLASNALDDDACITNLIRRIPLSEGPKTWSENLSDIRLINCDRGRYSLAVGNSIYSEARTLKVVFDAWDK